MMRRRPKGRQLRKLSNYLPLKNVCLQGCNSRTGLTQGSSRTRNPGLIDRIPLGFDTRGSAISLPCPPLTVAGESTLARQKFLALASEALQLRGGTGFDI